jgi:predicted alpha/beta-fold hydrolase
VNLKLIKSLLLICSSIIVSTAQADSDSYAYPIDEPYTATVVGTPPELRADLPKNIKEKNLKLTVFKDREKPDLFWYDNGLRYSLAIQKNKAPLIFIIAGTGASYNSGKMKSLQGAFYKAGFHVVSLSSTTYPNFIISASENSMPGHLADDAEDLYRVMQIIIEKHKNNVDVSDYYITGYSLGGAQAAFVSKLDETKQAINFKKVLMINPPVSLLNSVNLLDDLAFNKIPGGLDNFNQYLNNLVTKFSEAYNKEDDLEFDDNFLYTIYQREKPKDINNVAALIGLSFRLAAANMIFTTDVMTNSGYIVPKNRVLKPTDSLREYSIVSHRIKFIQYFDELLYPYYKSKESSLTRESLLEQFSLKSIEDYLRSSTKIGLMHNEDDLILAQGEIDYFKDVFKSRAILYPYGGHCGNLSYKQNIEDMLNFFSN